MVRPGSANPNWRGGKSSHPLYKVYYAMLTRCHNPNSTRFADYGGRGISVCGEWRADFWAYVRDVGEPPAPGMSIDRIDNDGDYAPGNVRWSTATEQRANQRPVTSCARGHAFDEENTVSRSGGRRGCKTCMRAYDRKWKQAKRDAAKLRGQQ